MSPGCSLDLVGRFRYMAKEQNTIHKRGVIPYFGGGGGVSRYASLSAAGRGWTRWRILQSGPVRFFSGPARYYWIYWMDP